MNINITQYFRMTFWVLVICIMILSLIPAAYISQHLFNWWDKAQHTLAFFILCGIGLGAYHGQWLKLVVGLIFFGAAIEVAQTFTSWRQGDGVDLLADMIGMLLALLLTVVVQQVYHGKD